MRVKVAARGWYTRALVRVLSTTTVRSMFGPHTFNRGDELEMVQWGHAGQPIGEGQTTWWTSYDVDYAWIIPAGKVEVIEVRDRVSPD